MPPDDVTWRHGTWLRNTPWMGHDLDPGCPRPGYPPPASPHPPSASQKTLDRSVASQADPLPLRKNMLLFPLTFVSPSSGCSAPRRVYFGNDYVISY